MKKKEKTGKKKGRREERRGRVERGQRRVLIETGHSSLHLKAVI